jgi:hypothetical protein
MPLRLADFPQLKLIAWNRREDDVIENEEALALCEHHWRYVDVANLTPPEKALINQLVSECGNGVLHV